MPIAAVLLALGASALATASPHDPPKRKPCGHERAWNLHRHGWADAKQTQKLDRLRHFADCARTKGKRRHIRAKIKRVKQKRRAARRTDCIPGVTVYAYGSQCTAIPGYIVGCESRGSWSAYNPSGAAAIYQIMPMHGRPWPVDSVADKRAHHRIASRLWAGGSGASNWVCS